MTANLRKLKLQLGWFNLSKLDFVIRKPNIQFLILIV